MSNSIPSLLKQKKSLDIEHIALAVSTLLSSNSQKPPLSTLSTSSDQPLSSATRLQNWLYQILKPGLYIRGEVTGNGVMERRLTDFGINWMILLS